MKLKELKSGMAVHCRTKEQAKEYCRQLELAGLCDYAICDIPFMKYCSELCYPIDALPSGWISYGKYMELRRAKRRGYTVIEFTDLEFDAPEETEQEKTQEEKKYIDADELLAEIGELLRSPWANDDTPIPRRMVVRDALGMMQSIIRDKAGMKIWEGEDSGEENKD